MRIGSRNSGIGSRTPFVLDAVSGTGMASKLTPVAFDIETTGFEADAVVTTIGFALPLGCRVLLGTDGRDVDTGRLEASLSERFGTEIRVSGHATERALLEATREFAAGTLAGTEYLLVAYNGERFNAGFDLPFLRTRYALCGIDWPFVDLPYADLLPLFETRFNTTGEDGSVADLAGVYEALVDDDLGAHDPFDSSREAVTAFEAGDFEALLGHNVADVLRTAELAALAERYCSKSDFNVKSLTPTTADPAFH